ncbi:MAG: RluA family pseudouridine synthase [Clostridia bacterium]|nr:RluA family pseudouridine synthase [Clostridia bacterium]
MRKLFQKEKPRVEKSDAPVYTATYKAQRSDELLEFLLRKCNTSRNNVKSLLARRQVLVNGKVITQYNFLLAKDDEIKISKRSIKDDGARSAPTQQQKRALVKPVPTAREMKIVYEDGEFLAVDKPAGLLSVESDTERVSAYAYAFEYLTRNDKTARPYVLHRIDKETSGILLFAKDIKIHSMLKMRWNDLMQNREYYAVVEGTPEKQSDTIVSYLKENQNKLMYSTQDPTGQRAVTHYETLQTNGKYSLLRVRIDTGRKNQIRVHMHAIGHSVVGDDKYGHTKSPFGRLGLHASKIEFTHPVSGQTLTFNAPLPPVFRNLFTRKDKV